MQLEYEIWAEERRRIAARHATGRPVRIPLRLLVLSAAIGAAICWRLVHG